MLSGYTQTNSANSGIVSDDDRVTVSEGGVSLGLKPSPEEHCVWVRKIEKSGGGPEVWYDYIRKLSPPVTPDTPGADAEYYDWLCGIYQEALQAIAEHKTNPTVARLMVDYAWLKSLTSVSDASLVLRQARAHLRRFAVVHIASAQLELNHGNRDLCTRLLQKARSLAAEPECLVMKAASNLSAGLAQLIDPSDYDLALSPSIYGTDASTGVSIMNLDTTGDTFTRADLSLTQPSLTGSFFQKLLPPPATRHHSTSRSNITTPLDRPPAPAPASCTKPIMRNFHSTPDVKHHGLAMPSRAPAPTSSTRRCLVDGSTLQTEATTTNQADNSATLVISPLPQRPVFSKSYDWDNLLSAQKPPAPPSQRLRRLPLQDISGLPNRSDSLIDQAPSLKCMSAIKASNSKLQPARITSTCTKLNLGSSHKPSHGDGKLVPLRVKLSDRYTIDDEQKVREKTEAERSLINPSANAADSNKTDEWNVLEGADTVERNRAVERELFDIKKMRESRNPLPDTACAVERHIAGVNSSTAASRNIFAGENVSTGKHPIRDERMLEKNPVAVSQKSVVSDAVLVRKTTLKESDGGSAEVKRASVEKSDVAAREDGTGKGGSGVERRGRSGVKGVVAETREVMQRDDHMKECLQPSNKPNNVPSNGPSSLVGNKADPAKSHQKSTPNAKSEERNAFQTMTVNNRSYYIVCLRGKGGSSNVYQGIDIDTKRTVAIKVVDLSQADDITVESYKNEVKFLERLQYSDNVIRLFNHEYNDTANTLTIVMEFGSTDLASILSNARRSNRVHGSGRMGANMLRHYWESLLAAVKVIHGEGIIHADLKPSNFILVHEKLKLIDFGIAKSVQPDTTSVELENTMGTLNYLSPEAITANPTTGKSCAKMGTKSDVWSLGCILYNMVYGRTPFAHLRHQHHKMQALLNPHFPIEYPPTDDPDLVDVMKKCLVHDPKERLSITELLQHRYITQTPHTQPAKCDISRLMEKIAMASPTTRGYIQGMIDKIPDKRPACPDFSS